MQTHRHKKTKGERYKHSNANVNKKIFVSEFGWGSAAVGETWQSNNLNTAYLQVFKKTNNVAIAFWFTLQDFSNQQWGLRTSNGTPRMAWYSYVNVSTH